MSAARPPALPPAVATVAVVAAARGGEEWASAPVAQSTTTASPLHLKRREEEGPISPAVHVALTLKQCPKGGGEQ
jgi:hypothetical protein